MQLGPMTRMPPRRASLSNSCSSRAPSGPLSLKPAEITIAPVTPASTHSLITPGTVAAGVTTTARSIGSGADLMFLYALIPSTLGRFGLIGWTVPPNGLLIRFQRTARPTLPCFSVAPITATVRGAKIASSGSRSILGSPPESDDMVGAGELIMKRDLLFCRSLENEDPSL